MVWSTVSCVVLVVILAHERTSADAQKMYYTVLRESTSSGAYSVFFSTFCWLFLFFRQMNLTFFVLFCYFLLPSAFFGPFFFLLFLNASGTIFMFYYDAVNVAKVRPVFLFFETGRATRRVFPLCVSVWGYVWFFFTRPSLSVGCLQVDLRSNRKSASGVSSITFKSCMPGRGEVIGCTMLRGWRFFGGGGRGARFA